MPLLSSGVLRQIVIKFFQTNALSLTIQLAVLVRTARELIVSASLTLTTFLQLTIVMSSETMWYTLPGKFRR